MSASTNAKAPISERASTQASFSSGPLRPPPRPLSVGFGASAGGGNSGSHSDLWLLTDAERRKLAARDEKREAEKRYQFLLPENIRDKDGHQPDHPDYDGRTLWIPKRPSDRYYQKFSPFEQQFWDIKQNFYDTVLFFQKGKFYELYEDDARIGHQEFDLKLTERVNMSMVRRSQRPLP